jgi:subtilisin family serine protease
MAVRGTTESVIHPQSNVGCRALIGLPALMERTAGAAAVKVAMIDGPVAIDHPDLASGNLRLLTGMADCRQPNSMACNHGTLVAGVMHARRDGLVPGICPDCTLLVRPIFTETVAQPAGLPGATLAEAAAAILEAIDAGARVINLSVGLAEQGSGSERAVEQALNAAAQHGVIVVAAAGNQGIVGSSVITRHPWVTSVIACNSSGRVMALSNLGASIGRRGLAAPGENIESLAAAGGTARFSGTSAAVPFVTGTFALLWSAFPMANATSLRLAVIGGVRRRSVTPPLLNAEAAYQTLADMYTGGHQP